MENLLVPIGVVGIVFGTIYKLFALFVRRRERILLIEKINDANVDVLYGKKNKNTIDYSPITWGSLFIGLGIGLLIGFIICVNFENYIAMKKSYEEIIYAASLMLFGGSGLIAGYFLDEKFGKKNTESDSDINNHITMPRDITHNEN